MTQSAPILGSRRSFTVSASADQNFASLRRNPGLPVTAREDLSVPAQLNQRGGERNGLIATLVVLCVPLIAAQFKSASEMQTMKTSAITASGALAIHVASTAVSAKHRAISLKENEREQSRLHVWNVTKTLPLSSLPRAHLCPRFRGRCRMEWRSSPVALICVWIRLMYLELNRARPS